MFRKGVTFLDCSFERGEGVTSAWGRDSATFVCPGTYFECCGKRGFHISREFHFPVGQKELRNWVFLSLKLVIFCVYGYSLVGVCSGRGTSIYSATAEGRRGEICPRLYRS